ncbi:hypothetical protein L6452_28735 [Arctium lappa]|uniref:Uncharacterized protein n=1 Tax=Arctium lappa TaxID=4217 RepID=A0ACB8ZZ32_ARCLA|nr:hypothetical protein L6452_28735 [Arctium lappa]
MKSTPSICSKHRIHQAAEFQLYVITMELSDGIHPWLEPGSLELDLETQFGVEIQKVDEYEKVEPHAFVHFVDPDSVNSLLEAEGKGELVFLNNSLKVSLGPENPYRMNQRRRTKEPIKLSNVVLEIGMFTSQDNFLVGWRGPESGVEFLVDPFDYSCKFLLTKDTAFSFKGTKNHAVIKCNYKVEFLGREVIDIKYSQSHMVLIFQLVSAPLICYRTADDDIAITHPSEMLDDDDPWIRTTDFTPSGAIGRCHTYRILIRIRDVPKAKKALAFLREQRVPIDEFRTELKVQNEPEFGTALRDREPFFCIQYQDDISFKVLFLINAVLHRGVINQHQFSEKVFDLLRDQSEEVNVAALKHICSYRRPLYDGFTQLKTVQKWLLNNAKLIEKQIEQKDITEVRRLIITPSKAYCLPPEVELSNRVLRHYREVSDRFLRVTFIKKCFSSTYATVEVPRIEVDLNLKDIKRNGYVFSDGIGKISPELALEVAEMLQLKDNQPCAYQIRYAGCKGVVVWWPDKKGDNIKLSLRPSMNKFESDHTVLEICSWTRLQPGFLNRQIITLLSALNVGDDIFWEMQTKMVRNLNQMLEDTDMAFDVITSSCAESGTTASIMLVAGFKPTTEPHLRVMLSSIRVAQLEDLREKSRIFVS